MGQLITVVETLSSRPGIVRYEINRPLSGMGHERYDAATPVEGDRPVDELARRMFATGKAASIHINGSIITVDLAKGSVGDGLADVIRDLFRFYEEGALPPTLEA